MDSLDNKIVKHLLRHGRATWAELGKILGLSAPSAADRVRNLEQAGVIRGYTAIPNPDALGYSLLAFVFVTLGSRLKRKVFLRAVAKNPQIAECHHVSGDYDYLLKVRCRGTNDLDHFLVVELKEKLAVAGTRTTIVLSTAKETIAVPVAP